MVIAYNPQEIEKKWQARWEADGLYRTEDGSAKPKWYELVMFPYTSGDLHIGHWYNYAPGDAHARFQRMQGYNVLYPIGFDAFGLPAENAAIARGIHPHKWTMDGIEKMRHQLRSIGAIYDWSREVITCLPEYYKWTQWLFLQLYHAGLAYRALAPANWCPRCQTVLANEQVVDGACERCHTSVTKRDLEQWFLRITRYAEELLDHSRLDWPERIKIMQRNWIGKSQGAEVAFGLEDSSQVRVFTTRPDTLYGVTFIVMAPEHPLVERLTTQERRAEVEAYVEQSRRESEIERLSTEKEKTGVFIGTYARNLLSGERVPIFIADYVLLSYGTGVVMGVPAHDQRDFEFAQRYALPIKVVIAPSGWRGQALGAAYLDSGTMVNSGPFDGLPSEEGKEKITDYLAERGLGRHTTTYRLRDWLISRQRYWGAPIPIVYCSKCGTVPIPEADLPVLLPEGAEFRPTGESPLKYHAGFVNARCPQCHGPAQRETDTMDTFICSSWYFLRYADPRYSGGPARPEKLKSWLPVDQYTGGAEHATMHLLYARFFTKALRDLGIVDFGEPFLRLFNQGIIVHEHQKMSKSRGNVVNPDDYVSTLGADTVRLYLMFLGPWELGGDWSDRGIAGVSRWLGRVWKLALELSEEANNPDKSEAQALSSLRRLTHRTLKRVTQDMEKFHFNTMVAALMEFTNALTQIKEEGKVSGQAWREPLDALLLMLAPSAPHLAEELWERTGHPYSIHNQLWPRWDEELAQEPQFTLVIQVDGKLRDKVEASVGITEAEVRELALSQERVRTHLNDRHIERLIYVPGRLVNIVTQ